MKKCTEQDREKLNEYLDLDPALNLFFIGDIENFGFDSDFQDVYIDEDEDGIHAMYLVYRDNLCIQSYEGKRDQAFVDELFQKYTINAASGETSLLEGYEFPELTHESECVFAQMEKENEMISTEEVIPLELLDVDEIVALEKLCFPATSNTEGDGIRFNLATGSGRYYGIRDGEKLVSVAGSTAECRNLGMIVGVCTHPDYRGKGYASKCITKLSNEMLKENKMPCLFFNDPAAATIYRKLGYEDIGDWSIRQRKND